MEKKGGLSPFIKDGTKEKEVTIITLNDDNTISRYNLNGKKVKGWKDIKAPEFIRDIPELKEFGNEKYWILKLPSQLKIYNYIGDEVAFTNNKLKIDRESEIEYEGVEEFE